MSEMKPPLLKSNRFPWSTLGWMAGALLLVGVSVLACSPLASDFFQDAFAAVLTRI